MKIDMHVHTEYSSDCLIKLSSIKEAVKRKGIHGVAICDHNEIEGALKLREIVDFPVIVGEEIMTTGGEIIGLFLNKKIMSGMEPRAAVWEIKEQGGLVVIPHPFDRLRSSALDPQALSEIQEYIDIIEVFNSRNVFQKDNDLAEEYADENKFNKCSGSDAHTLLEVGNAYIEIEAFSDAEDFLSKCKASKISGNKSSLLCHAFTKTYKSIKKVSVFR